MAGACFRRNSVVWVRRPPVNPLRFLDPKLDPPDIQQILGLDGILKTLASSNNLWLRP